MLEHPVEQATFSHKFEWEVAYVFPLAVIALIQLLLIFALLSEAGILPHTFLSVFLSLQNLANNNLYRILGVAMLIISVYPLVLKPDIIKKGHGVIIAFVGIIFLARGFVDLENRITNLYDVVFTYFDLPIAIIALVLIVYVIVKILLSARGSEKEFRITKHKINEENFSKENAGKKHHSKKHEDFEYNKKREYVHTKSHEKANMEKYEADVQFKKDIDMNKNNPGINESFDNIQFESNDLLDDYKK